MNAETNALPEHVGPEAILELGLGFWGSKTLLSAIELGVFTALAAGPLEGEVLAERLGLHARGARDFLDALVALGMLGRAGGRYSNTAETDRFLDRRKASYVGGLLEMANARLYPFWASLTEALRTGRPQNEAKAGGDFFAALYADSARLEEFLKAMTGLSMGAAAVIASKFPWRDYKGFVDVGCAQGGLAAHLCLAHPHLAGVGFDLPPVRPIFERYAAERGVHGRLRFQEGDFFRDPLPAADVVVMGNILHDWSLAEKQALIGRAFAALPRGGTLIVYESIIDDERRRNAFGLLMSLNMLIETPAGFDYTAADCAAWMRAAGFRATRVEHLAGPNSMVIGSK